MKHCQRTLWAAAAVIESKSNHYYPVLDLPGSQMLEKRRIDKMDRADFSGRQQLDICLLQITKAFLHTFCARHCCTEEDFSKYILKLVHNFSPQLEYRLEFFFSERFPYHVSLKVCFHTIKWKACLFLCTEQQM